MKPWLKIIVTAGACTATAWTGSRLAEKPPEELPLPAAASTPRRVSGAPFLNSSASQAQPQLSGCATTDLWQWLCGDEDIPEEFAPAVIDELLARRGMEIVERSFDLPDAAMREWASNLVLERWARRDPWSAYDLYQRHREDFPADWGHGALAQILPAACLVSADRFLEIAQQTPGAEFHPQGFAADFDFARAAAFYDEQEKGWMTVNRELLPEWVRRSPEAAAAWLVQQAPHEKEAWKSSNDSAHDFAWALQLMTLPDEERKEKLGYTSDLDPATYALAAMHHEDGDYLTECLFRSRGENELDPVWNCVPPAQRQKSVDAALAEWRKDDPSPRADRARQLWQQMLARKWH